MTSKQNQNIYLIGMMGSGKSTTGKLLANTLNRKFIDTDSLIELRSGKVVRDIFSQDGENRFREIESSVLLAVSKEVNLIVSTGGGILLKRANCDIIHESGTVILLYCQPDRLAGRITNPPERPLLKTDISIEQSLEDIWNSRKDLYHNNADFVVDTSLLSVAETVVRIVDLLRV